MPSATTLPTHGRPRARRTGKGLPSVAVADLKANRLPVLDFWPCWATVHTLSGAFFVRVEPDRNFGITTCTLDGALVGMVRLDPPVGPSRHRRTGRPAGRWLFAASCCSRRVNRLFKMGANDWQCRHCARIVFVTDGTTKAKRAELAIAKASFHPERRKGEKFAHWIRRRDRAKRAQFLLDRLLTARIP